MVRRSLCEVGVDGMVFERSSEGFAGNVELGDRDGSRDAVAEGVDDGEMELELGLMLGDGK